MKEDLKLGQIIKEPRLRDAIHIAVIPCVAEGVLCVGDWVAVSQENGVYVARRASEKKADGIVDPFLQDGPAEDDTFWVFLKPNTITSLRHEWTHPTIDTPSLTKRAITQIDSVRWVDEFASQINQTYDRLMEVAANYAEHGDWDYDNTEAYKKVPYEKWAEFWKHYEIITGSKVRNAEYGDIPFTCSC